MGPNGGLCWRLARLAAGAAVFTVLVAGAEDRATAASYTGYVVGDSDTSAMATRFAGATAGRAIPIPGIYDASAIAVTPDGASAYVVTDRGVVRMTLTTGAVEAPIAIPGIDSGLAALIAISPDGKVAYVSFPGGTYRRRADRTCDGHRRSTDPAR
jgi:DNA-binding beta-propeller fold protein YncE